MKVTSRVAVLPIDNIDTDQIIPARFLKVTDKEGLGAKLFHDWRYDEAGNPRPDFALNKDSARGVQVLLCGDNFGCGSSREHAPWALTDWGLRAIISQSFADIFKNNALKNGLVPVVVEPHVHAELLRAVQSDPQATVTVDVKAATLTLPDGKTVSFPIDPFAQTCLVQGVDELGYLLGFQDHISAYEGARR
jgi:3-isopropylmalate/(R)-2-methylmalate dehydratase small subunit